MTLYAPARSAAIVLLVAAATAACQSDEGPKLVCPRVNILADAASITRFAPGSGRDIVDVDHEGEMFGVTSGCEYDGRPNDFDRTLVVAVAPNIEAIRGPANTSREAVFPYFVSVVDADGNVSTKQEFRIGVRFEGNRSRIAFRDDDPPITITLPANSGVSPSSNRILVGFQLTPEELRFNRRARSSP